jgi:hypothetical protein
MIESLLETGVDVAHVSPVRWNNGRMGRSWANIYLIYENGIDTLDQYRASTGNGY